MVLRIVSVHRAGTIRIAQSAVVLRGGGCCRRGWRTTGGRRRSRRRSRTSERWRGSRCVRSWKPASSGCARRTPSCAPWACPWRWRPGTPFAPTWPRLCAKRASPTTPTGTRCSALRAESKAWTACAVWALYVYRLSCDRYNLQNACRDSDTAVKSVPSGSATSTDIRCFNLQLSERQSRVPATILGCCSFCGDFRCPGSADSHTLACREAL